MNHVTRVIHELDEMGNVLRIGWEPAASVIDREKAAHGVSHLINCVSSLLLIQADSEVREVRDTVDAMNDLRELMPALHRDYGHGLSLPRWQTAPQSRRYQRRAA